MGRFYGRHAELEQLRAILARKRWFFAKLSGRRRIGKTTLIQRALRETKQPVLYLQVPDSGPAGVLSSVRDAFETFGINADQVPVPTTLSSLASTIGVLAKRGYVVVLDEFQYFHRKILSEFTSHLQREVDALTAQASAVREGTVDRWPSTARAWRDTASARAVRAYRSAMEGRCDLPAS